MFPANALALAAARRCCERGSEHRLWDALAMTITWQPVDVACPLPGLGLAILRPQWGYPFPISTRPCTHSRRRHFTATELPDPHNTPRRTCRCGLHPAPCGSHTVHVRWQGEITHAEPVEGTLLVGPTRSKTEHWCRPCTQEVAPNETAELCAIRRLRTLYQRQRARFQQRPCGPVCLSRLASLT